MFFVNLLLHLERETHQKQANIDIWKHQHEQYVAPFNRNEINNKQ